MRKLLFSASLAGLLATGLMAHADTESADAERVATMAQVAADLDTLQADVVSKVTAWWTRLEPVERQNHCEAYKRSMGANTLSVNISGIPVNC